MARLRKPNPASPANEPVTRARHDDDAAASLARLRDLIGEGRLLSFEVGDLVEHLNKAKQMTVQRIADELNATRTRLNDMRITAVAFPPAERWRKVDFLYYTITARAARQMHADPAKVLDTVIEKKFNSVRKAKLFLAAQVRAAQNGAASQAAGLLIARDGHIIDRCHHADFRNVMPELADASAKLIIADPPHGRNDRKTTTSVTTRTCDGDTEAEAQQAITDLFKLAGPKLAPDGCLILFRPGADLDPPWLPTAIADHGWTCVRALTWVKTKVSLGRSDAPYGIATERILVLARQGARLINHNNSDRADVLSFKPVMPRANKDVATHIYEKPELLMRHLIAKHSFEGELVIEPFGGTGPASRVAAKLNRHWVYCESNAENFALGSARIAPVTSEVASAAG